MSDKDKAKSKEKANGILFFINLGAIISLGIGFLFKIDYVAALTVGILLGTIVGIIKDKIKKKDNEK